MWKYFPGRFLLWWHRWCCSSVCSRIYCLVLTKQLNDVLIWFFLNFNEYVCNEISKTLLCFVGQSISLTNSNSFDRWKYFDTGNWRVDPICPALTCFFSGFQHSTRTRVCPSPRNRASPFKSRWTSSLPRRRMNLGMTFFILGRYFISHSQWKQSPNI